MVTLNSLESGTLGPVRSVGLKENGLLRHQSRQYLKPSLAFLVCMPLRSKPTILTSNDRTALYTEYLHPSKTPKKHYQYQEELYCKIAQLKKHSFH